MGVKFILGKASLDHQSKLNDQLDEWIKRDPEAQFFYVVPEHIKFESEVAVLNHLRKLHKAKFFASANVQVLSFTRMAWFFLRNTSVMHHQNLSQTGMSMVITHLLNKLQSRDLKVFANEQNQTGFSVKLANQLIELRLGGFSPDDLQTMQCQAENQHQANLADKLNDLRIIYQEFLNYKINGQLLFDQFVDSAKLMDLLIEELQQIDISHQYFLFSGFDHFNAREIQIIRYLMNHAHDVLLSLILTKKALKDDLEPTALFYRPVKMYYRLKRLAPQSEIEFCKNDTLRVSSSLQKLEAFWIGQRTGSKLEQLTSDEKRSLSITQTVDRIDEVKTVAGRIRQIVTESQQTSHPYEYRDFLILTPDTQKYQNIIEPLFEQYQIPLFTDLTQTMSAHPLVEFITSLFEVERSGFNYQTIMRFLKTELFIPKQIITGRTLKQLRKNKQIGIYIRSKTLNSEDVQEIIMKRAATFRNTLDIIENYLLAHGIHTKDAWKQEWIVQTLPLQPGETQEMLIDRERKLVINRNVNLVRKQVVELFDHFDQKLKTVKNGREFATVFYEILDQAGVAETLRQWQQGAQQILNEHHGENDATLHGNAIDPTRPEQVWSVFCQLLDEYVLALGDEQFDSETFMNIFKSGFEAATYKRIPSTLDQVIFSSSSTMQMMNRKITFIIGATDDVMPARIENQKILSENDRNELKEMLQTSITDDKFLPETNEIQMANEPFTNYLAFMSSSEQLHFLYPMNDVDGSELYCSKYVEKIKKAFNLPIQKRVLMNSNQVSDVKDFIGTPLTTLNELLQLCQRLKHQGECLSQTWTTIYQYLKAKNPQRVNRLFNSLNYQNEVLPTTKLDNDGHKKLDPRLVEKLYGNVIYGSVSRLETYFKNPYEYFLKYGLSLKPREIFEPTSANIGDFFHMVMARLIDEVQRAGQTLTTLSSSDFDRLLGKVLNDVAAIDEFHVFDQTARNRYLKSRLMQSTRKVSRALYRQHQKRKVFSLVTEASFGFDQKNVIFNGIQFNASQLQRTPVPKLNLQGRLDRIDVVEDAHHHLYYNVADYKSGSIETKLDKFLIKSYSGISLQLLTYLAVLRDNRIRLLQLIKNNPILQSKLKDANQKDISLGSAVYLHLGTPHEKQNKYQKITSSQKALQSADKKFSYDGIFIKGKDEPADYVKALGAVYDGKNQFINLDNYRLNLLKNGKLSKASLAKMYDFDQFNALLDLDLYRVNQAANDIFSGVIDLAPYRLGNANGLDYSDYLPIMNFDPLIGNHYRNLDLLTQQSNDEIWQQIEMISNQWRKIRKSVKKS